MSRTPGLIVPSAYSSQEELLADLRRRSEAAGFTPLDLDEIAHSETNAVDDILQHFGVKGMKWGILRDKKFLNEARERSKDTFKRGVDDHKDKSAVREFRKRADKSGVRTLGDKELKQLVARAKLENEFRELRQKEKEASQAFIKAIWNNFGKEILGAVIREGVAYKFRGGNNGGGSTRTNVVDGRVIEGASRAIGRFASSK